MSAFTINSFYVVNIFRRILLSFHKQTHMYIYNRLYVYFELHLSLTYTAHIAAEKSSGKEMKGKKSTNNCLCEVVYMRVLLG